MKTTLLIIAFLLSRMLLMAQQPHRDTTRRDTLIIIPAKYFDRIYNMLNDAQKARVNIEGWLLYNRRWVEVKEVKK